MESTGVFWIPLFQILETRGFEVKLVNAYHVKSLPGRKSDVLDCQWLQQLHSYGLERRVISSGRLCLCPTQLHPRLETTSSRVPACIFNGCVHALTQMNVQLHQVGARFNWYDWYGNYASHCSRRT